MKKKTVLRILLIAVLIPALVWVGSLIKCEILTQKYYDDFRYAYAASTMLGQMEYFKVLRCDDSTAEVYYVGKGMSSGDVLCFERIDGTWTQVTWDTVWSDSGSASDVIYPYWWHFIYGGI